MARRAHAKPYPFLPADTTWTIDLTGIPAVYVSFARRSWRRAREDARLDAVCLDALRADYAFRAESKDLPEPGRMYWYSATYHDQGLEQASHVLLGMGVRARFHIHQGRDRLCTLLLGTERPLPHVLGQFFPQLRSVTERQHARLLKHGDHDAARRLKRLTLPGLPGLQPDKCLDLPMPRLEPFEGEKLVLGHVLSPLTRQVLGPAEIPLERLTRGTLVSGTTGGGKTNTVHHVIHQVRNRAWVLAMDVKREYRSLFSQGARVYGFRGQSIFTHNLLKPVGSPEQWVKEFASILSEVIHRYAPAVGSKDVVIQELNRLYRERGVYDGATDYPHVGNLVQALEARQREAASREAGWTQSALRVLRSLMVGSTREAFCVREGLALESLFRGVTVLELEGLGDRAAESLLASVLLQKIRNHHLDQDPPTGLRGLVVVEEAHRLLPQGGEASSVLTETCREIRSTGIGLVLVTQMPSEFSKHALANVNTLITHRLTHPSDRSLMARMTGLPSETQAVFGELPVGQGVVHMDQVLLVRVPEVERAVVRDADLPQTVERRVEREEVAAAPAQRREVENRAVDLTDREWSVLEAICEGRAVYPSQIRDELGMSYRDVGNLLGVLIRHGFIRYASANRRGRGRAAKVHFPTPYGQEAYRARCGQYPDRTHTAAMEHAQAVQQVVSALGVERRPHRRFDILCDLDGREVGVEVETGANNNAQIRENLEKSLEAQGDAWFVCCTPTTRNRVLQAAARRTYDAGERVTLRLALLEEVPSWSVYTVRGARVA